MTRLMPEKIDFGRQRGGSMSFIMTQQLDPYPNIGLRQIMGFNIPTWQRDLVWTKDQSVRFIESAWKGIPLGTFSYNEKLGTQFDGLLIDGQQRLHAIEQYLNDEFMVFGHLWSETTPSDKRHFKMSIVFPCFETQSDDEQYLREYYDLMNFSGTEHKPEERALPAP